MVSVQVSPSQFKDLSDEQEAEAQNLAFAMFSKNGSYAKYSQYASDSAVRERLKYLWNKEGASAVKNFQNQQKFVQQKEQQSKISDMLNISNIPQSKTGVLFIKPSEKGLINPKNKATYYVPETNEVYSPKSKGFVSVDTYNQQQNQVGKPNETYDAKSGMFVSQSQTGGQATLIMRKPTYQEALQLNKIEQQEEYVIDERTGKPYGKYEAIERQKGLAGVQQRIQEQRSIKGAEIQRGQAIGNFEILPGLSLFGLGIASSVVGTAQSVKEFIYHPIGTIGDLATNIYGETKSFFTTGGTGFGEKAGNVLRNEPWYATGYVAGELAQIYAPKLITKGTDILRTKGLSEIEAKDIIAPEYYAGQTFPTIKRGQTAGELLSEFKQPSQFGVSKLTGFTASPKPIKAELGALPGTSELAGIYQAPKVSPSFLRVAGEEKLFTLNPFKTSLRPTITQIIPESFELAPGVSFSQSNLASLNKIKSAWRNLDLGKSFVPFVKTEKEAIITAGSPLYKTGKYFYINFEGRRVPIVQLTTISPETNLLKKTYSISDISKISSSKVGKTAYFSSYDIARNILPKSYSSKAKGSISYLPSISSYSKVSSSISKPIYSSKFNSYKPSINYIFSPTKTKSSGKLISSITSVSKTRKPFYSSISYPSKRTRYAPVVITPKRYTQQSKRKSPLQQNSFNVYMRRFGKWKLQGTNLDLQKAFSLGRKRTQQSLGASFLVQKQKGNFNLINTMPKMYYSKPTKRGIILIQRRKFRLSTGGEKREIQGARKKKKRGFSLF